MQIQTNSIRNMADKKKLISEILEEAGEGTKCWNDTFGELTFLKVMPRISVNSEESNH